MYNSGVAPSGTGIIIPPALAVYCNFAFFVRSRTWFLGEQKILNEKLFRLLGHQLLSSAAHWPTETIVVLRVVQIGLRRGVKKSRKYISKPRTQVRCRTSSTFQMIMKMKPEKSYTFFSPSAAFCNHQAKEFRTRQQFFRHCRYQVPSTPSPSGIKRKEKSFPPSAMTTTFLFPVCTSTSVRSMVRHPPVESETLPCGTPSLRQNITK